MRDDEEEEKGVERNDHQAVLNERKERNEERGKVFVVVSIPSHPLPEGEERGIQLILVLVKLRVSFGYFTSQFLNSSSITFTIPSMKMCVRLY